jgi:hypothetical protein
MSVTSRTSTTPQTIPAGPTDQYVKLDFGGVTEVPTDAGRTLVVAWVSSDAFPPRLTADTLRQKVIDATQGSTAWNAAVEAALLFLLRPPLVKFRAVRPFGGDLHNETERWVSAAPLITDLGISYIAEFNVEKDGDLVSVEIAKSDKATVLNFRELKIDTIVPKEKYL